MIPPVGKPGHLPTPDIARLRPVTNALAREKPPREVLTLILGTIAELTGGSFATLVVRPASVLGVLGVDRGPRTIVLGLDGEAITADGPIADFVVANANPARPVLVEEPPRLVLAVGKGGICVDHVSPSSLEEPTRVSLLSCLADLAASALNVASRYAESTEKARALEQAQTRLTETNLHLQDLLVLDELTGCHNRRYFDQRLEDELERLHRYGRPLALILFDIDHFKQVNDNLGHLAGDDVLKFVAECARVAARRTDVVARFGGDEFAVLMPETDADGALVVGQRLRNLVAQSPAPTEAGPVQTTLSVGVVGTARRFAGGADALIRLADAALYRSKQNGRNRVSINPAE